MTYALVMDDESDVRSMIGGLATQSGFEVEFASNSTEFFEQTGKRRHDLIILDLLFPVGDGIELLRFLEAQSYKGAIILVSGMDHRVLTTARCLGVELGLNVIGSVQKPFKVKLLQDLLDQAWANIPESSQAEFRRAINGGELVLHYQPVVDMTSDRIVGTEALVRWRHPKRGLIMPEQFLPDFTRENLMGDLTWWVVETAIKDSIGWLKAGIDLRIAVNVPSSVLSDPSFHSTLLELRRRASPLTPRLMIEVTETEAMNEPVQMMEVLSRLRLAGIELAIDDFGTGYSSLVELRRQPVTHLKIDKSFVLGCVSEPDAAAITRAVIELGHALDVKVIAEGVETEKIWQQLDAWGCDAAQGYLISRPIPEPDLLTGIATSEPWRAALRS